MDVGVISDTHNLLRPQALDALRGVEYILHAGDVGEAEILEQLEEVAPVSVVRGNTDTAPWARRWPLREAVQLDGRLIYMVHDIEDLDIVPLKSEVSVVVSGHSHRPAIERRDGVMYLNPGSAGPRRFTLPVTLARLRLSRRGVEAEIIPFLGDLL